jgi:hypothetical protein
MVGEGRREFKRGFKAPARRALSRQGPETIHIQPAENSLGTVEIGRPRREFALADFLVSHNHNVMCPEIFINFGH